MELWDTYDIHGNKTGKILQRGADIQEGEFHLVVHILPYYKDRYLVQKRSELKNSNPLIWSVTGGSAIKGESGMEAAIRETKEELGIDIISCNPRKISRLIRSKSLADIWMFKCEIPVEEIEFNPVEVEDIKWLEMKEIKKMVVKGEFYNYGEEYFAVMEDGLKK